MVSTRLDTTNSKKQVSTPPRARRTAHWVPPLDVKDVVRLEAPTKYRLTTLQILVIQKMWNQQKKCGRHNVEAICRVAKCTRNSVLLWRDRTTTECAVGAGRPVTALTPPTLGSIKKVVKEHRRKPLTHGQLLAKLHAKNIKLTSSTLHRAKKKLGIRLWLPRFKKATGVVLDNAGPHKGLMTYLRARGVNVIEHRHTPRTST